ncbi:hypothetical protein BASA83_004944 [Batrachochytrium salamandrivorans]|nr:hypothetical protein BASA83_004944 [Batrachochytrium salamandrivorans]
MKDIVGPYVNKYIDQEMEHLNKRFTTELDKGIIRNQRTSKQFHPPSGTFFNADHVQAHKRFVMGHHESHHVCSSVADHVTCTNWPWQQ